MLDGLDTAFSELVILNWIELNWILFHFIYLHTKTYKYITDYFMLKLVFVYEYEKYKSRLEETKYWCHQSEAIKAAVTKTINLFP